jgi:MFS family permease
LSLATQPSRFSKVSQFLVWGFGLLYAFSRLIPGHPVSDFPNNVPLDNGWAQILHEAYARHLQFGREVVFTYGPWGFLAGGYYPPTYLISVAAWLALASVFVCAGWRLARHFTQNHLVAWLWLIGFTLFASLPSGNDINELLVAWAVLLLFLHFFVEDRAFPPLQAALVFTFGWLGLVKFTGLMLGGLIVVLIAGNTIAKHRRFPWIIPVWLAGIIFFWLFAGQHLNLLWPFLRNSWSIAGGYTDAMSIDGILSPTLLIFAVVGLGFCGLAGVLALSNRAWNGAFFVLGIAGIVFLSFKESCVRDDDAHGIAAVLSLLLIALAFFPVTAAHKKALVPVAILLALLSLASLDHAADFLRQSVKTFTPYNLLCPLVNLGAHNLQDDYEKSQANLREQTYLPPVSGPVDLYSCRQEYLLAYGMDYRPRPIIQSYSAYTPYLARMNADWLRSDQAATTLFFAVQVLDDKFSAMDDGLSWPELLTRYDIPGLSDKFGNYLVLSRSPRPRGYHLRPFPPATITLGLPFAPPNLTNGLVWAEIDIKKTLAGDLQSFLDKPSALMADLQLADGSRHRCRIVPGVASAGFLLSPYIQNNRSFLALARADQTLLSSKAVVSLTLWENEQPGAFQCYQPLVNIRFYRLDIPAQPINFPYPELPPISAPAK